MSIYKCYRCSVLKVVVSVLLMTDCIVNCIECFFPTVCKLKLAEVRFISILILNISNLFQFLPELITFTMMSNMINNSTLQGDENFDFLFKVVLIGDCGTGKTCVVQRFRSGTYVERQGSTIGVDFSMKTIFVEGKKIKVRSIFNGSVKYYYINSNFTPKFRQDFHFTRVIFTFKNEVPVLASAIT